MDSAVETPPEVENEVLPEVKNEPFEVLIRTFSPGDRFSEVW